MSSTSTQGRSAAQLAPTIKTERSEILDVVRGFALLGVIVMNWFYAGVWDLLTLPERQAMGTAGFDRIVQMLDMLLFEDKFYTIFSMLFGLGFALQLGRASSRGQNLIPTYARRLTILFFIGIAHAVFLYYGDILHVYALLGFVLIPFRNRSDRFILGWAAVIALFVLSIPLVEPFVSLKSSDASTGGGEEFRHAERLACVTTGGWHGIVRFNLNMLAADYGSIRDVVEWNLNVLWRFLFGFWVGRRALLRNASEHVDVYRRLLPWALVIGLSGTGVRVGGLFGLFDLPAWLLDRESPVQLTSIVAACATPVLALAYVWMLILIYEHPGGRRLLGRLAPLGRMALSNYLMQSVVLVFLFFGVGLGLAGRVGIGVATLLAITTLSLQIVFSTWWLEHFRFGPAEWAWRCATYGRWVPIR